MIVRARTGLKISGFPAFRRLNVDVVVVADQARRPADLLHHGVAGVYT